MRRLMRANHARLMKSRALWVCAASAMLLSALFMANLSIENPRLDDVFLQLFPFLPVLYAAFASLFLGVEYQDGTLRNKIIAGHSRVKIYIAALIAVMEGCFVIAAAWALGSAAVGGIRFGGFAMPAGAILGIAMLILLLTAAEAAILTALCMLMTNRAAAAVAAILLMFALLAVSSSIYGALSEPEMISSMIAQENGFEFGDLMPNPRYVSGARRAVDQAIMEILPSGQAILLANQELARPILSACASVGIAILASAIGIAAFRRKDLR